MVSWDIGGVRTGDIRFSHGEGRANFAIEQRCQPALLLFRRAKLGQYLHIASIGCGTVKDLRSPADAPMSSARERIPGWSGRAIFCIGQKEFQPLCPGLFFQFIDNFGMVVGVAESRDLLPVGLLIWENKR